MNVQYIGDGSVVLIAGGGRVYTDVAARFTRSEKGLSEIIATPYNESLVQTIVDKGHLAATEFDYFIFGIEGYSRVAEVQLVRKRMANYLIKSGRIDKHGKRSFDVVVPDKLLHFNADCTLSNGMTLPINGLDILGIIEQWYNSGVERGIPEEELRYLKPQATEFKAIVGMNAHALIDWFKIRCCKNAQAEIRDMAWKMLKICKEVAPALFEHAGPSCVALGYCPENDFQNKDCSVIRKNEAMEILKNASNRKEFEF